MEEVHIESKERRIKMTPAPKSKIESENNYLIAILCSIIGVFFLYILLVGAVEVNAVGECEDIAEQGGACAYSGVFVDYNSQVIGVEEDIYCEECLEVCK